MLDDGVLQIATLTNTAEAGRMPHPALLVKCRAFYQERRITYSRHYSAMAAGQKVDRICRVQLDTGARSDMYAIDETTGEQYRITLVQNVDVDGLKYLDLTMEREENRYDVE